MNNDKIHFNMKKNYIIIQTYISSKYIIKNIYINKYIFSKSQLCFKKNDIMFLL